jgi:formate hydrogenlyase subunit 4
MSGLIWFIQFLEVLLAVLVAPLFAGWIAQCRAVLQNRKPPSIWLPYRNIRKLLEKEAVLAEHASPLFRAAPYIVFGTMVCAAAIVPSTPPRASSCRSPPWTSARRSARSARGAR